MGLFEKKIGIDELEKRLVDFDMESARLATELDKAQRQVSVLLAKNESASEALEVSTSLTLALDARPSAKLVLERELAHLRNEKEAAALKTAISAVEAWLSGPVAKAGEQLVEAAVMLAKALSEWNQVASAAPPEAGPAGDLVALDYWRDARNLASLGKGLGELAQCKGVGLAETAIRNAMEMIKRQATQGLEARLVKVHDPEPGSPELKVLRA